MEDSNCKISVHDQRSGDTEATVEIIGHRIENVRIARAEIQKIAFPKIST